MHTQSKTPLRLIVASLVAVAMISSVSAITAGPLEEIKVTAKLTMKQDEGKHIITNAGIYRLSISDKAICDARLVTPTQISLIAKRPGKTHVTFWLEGQEATPSKIEISVIKKKEKKKK